MPTKQSIVSPRPEYPTHVPHLSYRNSLPSDYLSVGSGQSTSTIGTAVTTNTAATVSTITTSPSDVESGPGSPGFPGLTLSSSLTPAPRFPSPRSSTMSTTASPAKNKKKPSFLGTLFTKEPSTDAFLQMQNQSRKQLAQHPGRKNPPGMSGVSSVRMPEHVPKVNSRWDGMPQRANEDHDRSDPRSDARRNSTRTSSTSSCSPDPRNRGSHRPPLSSSNPTSNHADKGRSRKTTTTHQNDKRVGLGEVDSVAESVSSCNSIKHPPSKSMSIRTQSLRSPSGSSLPQITSFFPNEIPEPPGFPQIGRVHALSVHGAPDTTDQRATRDLPRREEPAVGAFPFHASSSSLSSPEQSPITPLSEPISVHPLGQSVVKSDDSLSFFESDLEFNEVVLRSCGSDGLGPPTVARKVSKESARAFLAGEARPLRLSNDEERSPRPNPILKNGHRPQVFGPAILVQQDLEKRPDSSRARLGLRASMIRSSDAVPWDWDEEQDSRSDTPNRAASPKIVLPKSLGIFGKT